MSFCTIEEAWGGLEDDVVAAPRVRREKREKPRGRRHHTSKVTPTTRATGAVPVPEPKKKKTMEGVGKKRRPPPRVSSAPHRRPIEHYTLHDHNQADATDQTCSPYDASPPATVPSREHQPQMMAQDPEPSIDTFDAAGHSAMDMRAFSRDLAPLPRHTAPRDRVRAPSAVEIDAAKHVAHPYDDAGPGSPFELEETKEKENDEGDDNDADYEEDDRDEEDGAAAAAQDGDWVRNNISYMTEQIGHLTAKVDRLGRRNDDGYHGDDATDRSPSADGSPLADTILFISAGAFGIVLLDLFLRAGQRIAHARM